MLVVGLFDGDPRAGGRELAYRGYERRVLADPVDFPQAEGKSQAATHFAVFEDEAMIRVGDVQPIRIEAGVTPRLSSFTGV